MVYVCSSHTLYRRVLYRSIGRSSQSRSWSAQQGKLIFSCPRSRLIIWSRETAVLSRVSLTIMVHNIWYIVYVVVFFTLTDRASTIPSNIRGCQSGTWSQRGTKVNRSHHGDNPLLRPTGIQIATKKYATLQAMAPTNNKTVHQTSFTPYGEQPRYCIHAIGSVPS